MHCKARRDGGPGILLSRVLPQPARMPVSLIILRSRLIWDLVFAANCSGEVPSASTPMFASCSLASVVFRSRTIS